MPKLEWNKQTWDGGYDWQYQGDEWSQKWGGPFMQWYGTILPRIHRFVPTGTILEIAPGHGRWTQFLKDLCHTLIAVDLSQTCADACRKRFSNCSHISVHVNDGTSLEMVDDNTVDFAFTFDSLVHVDDDVIESYVAQLARKLSTDGVAFIHHSNLGAYRYLESLEKLPPDIQHVLARLRIMEASLHHRSRTMTAARFRSLALQHELECTSQEIVPWGTRRILLDCMSTVMKKNSSRCRDHRVFRNRSFMREAEYLSRLSWLYGMPIERWPKAADQSDVSSTESALR